jgi:hypothetical protein
MVTGSKRCLRGSARQFRRYNRSVPCFDRPIRQPHPVFFPEQDRLPQEGKTGGKPGPAGQQHRCCTEHLPFQTEPAECPGNFLHKFRRFPAPFPVGTE